MTLPTNPMDPRVIADEIARRTRALTTACQFARLPSFEATFSTMFDALRGFTVEEIEYAVNSIAADAPTTTAWVPSSEIAKRVKALRQHRRDLESGIAAGRNTDPAERAAKEYVARIVRRLEQKDAEAGGPGRRIRGDEPSEEAMREAAANTEKLRQRNAEKGRAWDPADEATKPKSGRRASKRSSSERKRSSDGSRAGGSG